MFLVQVQYLLLFCFAFEVMLTARTVNVRSHMSRLLGQNLSLSLIHSVTHTHRRERASSHTHSTAPRSHWSTSVCLSSQHKKILSTQPPLSVMVCRANEQLWQYNVAERNTHTHDHKYVYDMWYDMNSHPTHYNLFTCSATSDSFANYQPPSHQFFFPCAASARCVSVQNSFNTISTHQNRTHLV